jgi:beta-lactamase class A
LAAVFVVFIFGFILIHSLAGSGTFAEAFSSITTSSDEKAAAAKEIRMQEYKTTVDKIIAAHPDQNIAVSSIDLSDNSLTALGDSGTYTGASTAKLITAIAILHQTELGTITLSDDLNGVTVRTLLQNMIVNSDNDAWLTLNTYLTHETLGNYMTTLGWKDYDPDVNTFIPADMARLMQKFYEGKLINDSHKQFLLGLMQQANKQDYIVDSVQTAGSGYTVYHKAGWLDGLMHDVAIINDGKKTIVLTIYTYSDDAAGDCAANQTTFKDITAAAMQAYFPSSQQ